MKQTYKKVKKMFDKAEMYISRTKAGFCKNEDCNKRRRHCSAYCGECKK